MSKLLVDAPPGWQELLEIGPGGNYFNQPSILWDERIDGPLPAITLGGMIRQGNALVFNQARMDASTAALAPKTPTQVEKRKFLKALILANQDTAFDSALPQSGGGQQGKLNRADWAGLTQVNRNSALLESVRIAAGWTHAEVDGYFMTAAGLNGG